ncbi:MAG TPA: hypothetical protein VFK15_11045 [Burkholderiales bacterium]|jgi:hypothetical protein|nr:hypothetical protein [Burkholderiales bacterium]
MKTIGFFGVVLGIAAAVASAPLHADKPSWAGGGQDKGKGHSRDRDRGGDRDHGSRGGERFSDHQRVVIREYYHTEFRGGHCPPGLAKKHNGCMPPGQAKKWRVGYALPREVIYYELPPALVVRIGVPPPGYKYVRVAADILMIAAGTGMVVSAIEDLGRM